MKKILYTLTLLLLTTVTTTLYAGGKNVFVAETVVVPIPEKISPIPLYIGLGLVSTLAQRDPCPCDKDGNGLKDRQYGGAVRAGYDFNNYFGIEARAIQTIGENVYSKVRHYGLYLKPQYHIFDQANLYLLLGYGQTIVDYTNGKISSRNIENGISYGGGIEYDLTGDDKDGFYDVDRPFDGQGDQEKGLGLWIDYQDMLRKAGKYNTDLDVITAGLTYDF